MAFFNVSRPIPGGYNGYGAQTVWQTSVQSATVTPTPPTGGTVTLNTTATVQQDWAMNANTGFTVLPTTVTDHYGGFPH